MNAIDVRDREISVNGGIITFPASYAEVKEVLGEARIVPYGSRNIYVYDQLGIIFGEAQPQYLMRLRAFKDRWHMIVYCEINATGLPLLSSDPVPANPYSGTVTFFGEKGTALRKFSGKEKFSVPGAGRKADIAVLIGKDDSEPNYDGELLKKNVYLSYSPEKPKCTENYGQMPACDNCLEFDNFNFKLAVIQELMYNRQLLKPCFDIYDYLEYKKSKASPDTEKNIKAAMTFFAELPIPASMAGEVTEIVMDGGNEIYGNIAPLWDGEDGRFDLNNLTLRELQQFTHLKRATIMSSQFDKVKKIFEKAGIEAEEL